MSDTALRPEERERNGLDDVARVAEARCSLGDVELWSRAREPFEALAHERVGLARDGRLEETSRTTWLSSSAVTVIPAYDWTATFRGAMRYRDRWTDGWATLE